MKILTLVTALLAVPWASAQNYATGRATGYVVLKDNQCLRKQDSGPPDKTSVLAIHDLSKSEVEASTWRGGFTFTPLRIYPDDWKIKVDWEGYLQKKDKDEVTHVHPRANDSAAVVKEYVCMAEIPPKRRSALWLPDPVPIVRYGFGGDPWAPTGQPPASPPPPLPVTGKITIESGAGAKGMVRLYVIRVSKGSLVQLAFAPSNRNGEFQFKFDPPALSGLDRLYISAKGPSGRTYSDFVAQDDLAQPLDLRIARTPRLEPALNPGETRGITFGPGLLRSLPLPGSRDINRLILLAPGVFPAAETAGLSGPGLAPGIGAAGEFSVNGLRSRQNNFILDGADNTNEETGVPRHGFVFLAPLPVESVTELQAMTGSTDARFGRSAGAQINVLSSSGAAGFHGAAYGYFTGQRLNARNFFDTRPSTLPVPLTGGPNNAPVTLDGKPALLPSPVNHDLPFTRTQAGIVIGGPLAIHHEQEPRTFFFAAFEDQVRHAANQTHFSVPTISQRGYKNSGGTGITSSDGEIAVYPSSLAGDAIFSLYPFPNNPAGPFGANTWTEVLPAGGSGHLFSLKLDRYVRAFHANNVVTARYSQTDESSDLPAVDGALFSAVSPQVRTRSFASFFDTNFARRWANTFRFGWGRAALGFDEKRDRLQLPSSLFPAEPFLLNQPLLLNVTLPGGVPAFASALQPLGAIAGTEQLTGPIGRVNVPGFSSVGVDTFHFPKHQASDTFQWADTVTRTTGRSNLALGFEIWRISLDSAMERNARPELTFYGQVLRVLGFEGAPRPTDGSLLDPASVVAAGLVPSFRLTLAKSPDHTLSLHRNQIDFFFQEDFHILPKLTLIAGGRFQIQRLPQSDDGRFSRSPDRSLFDRGICKGAPDSCSAEIDLLANAFPVGFQKAFGAQSFNTDIRFGLALDPWGTGTTPIRFSIGTYSSQLPATIIDDSRNVFPQSVPLDSFLLPCPCGIFSPRTSLSDGSSLNLLSLQAAANPVAALALMSNPPALQVVQPAPNLGSPSSLQFSLGLQQRLKGSGFFSVGYVGTSGRDLLRVRVEGAAGPPGFALLSIAALGGGSHIPAFFGTMVPASVPGAVSKLLYETTAGSRFDSLQSEFRSSVRSLQFGAAFTWSHSIDDASDVFNTTGSFALPQNNAHLSERGSSSFDARLRGTGYFVWDLPHLSRRTALNGWQLAGTVTAQTGQPFTVNTAFDINNDGVLTDRLATTNGLLGSAIGRPISGASRTTLLALSPGTNPATLLAQPGSDGIVGRNTFRAGSIASIDLALSKTFAFKERYRVAWRLESFNTANRSNFGIPVRILESPAFGQATRTVTPNRILQIAGRFDF